MALLGAVSPCRISFNMAASLRPPLSVSPFIRACRWGALTLGIMYGVHRHRKLSKEEAIFREIETKRQAELAKKMEVEKNRNNRVELLSLAQQLNVPVPEDFDKQYPPQ